MSQNIIEAFHQRKRSDDLPFVEGDTAKVTSGAYAGQVGTVELVDTSKATLQFLVGFGDGTDELIAVANLEPGSK